MTKFIKKIIQLLNMEIAIKQKTFFNIIIIIMAALAVTMLTVLMTSCTKENLGTTTVVTGTVQIPADAKFVRVVQVDLNGASAPSEAEPIPAQ